MIIKQLAKISLVSVLLTVSSCDSEADFTGKNSGEDKGGVVQVPVQTGVTQTKVTKGNVSQNVTVQSKTAVTQTKTGVAQTGVVQKGVVQTKTGVNQSKTGVNQSKIGGGTNIACEQFAVPSESECENSQTDIAYCIADHPYIAGSSTQLGIEMDVYVSGCMNREITLKKAYLALCQSAKDIGEFLFTYDNLKSRELDLDFRCVRIENGILVLDVN